jgi:hypothetical protein
MTTFSSCYFDKLVIGKDSNWRNLRAVQSWLTDIVTAGACPGIKPSRAEVKSTSTTGQPAAVLHLIPERNMASRSPACPSPPRPRPMSACANRALAPPCDLMRASSFSHRPAQPAHYQRSRTRRRGCQGRPGTRPRTAAFGGRCLP